MIYVVVAGALNLLNFCISTLRSPNDERDIELLGRSRSQRYTVHIESSFAKRLSVVGHENYARASIRKLPLQHIDYRMNEVVGIYDGVVVGIYQLLVFGICHLNGSTLGQEYLELFGSVAVVFGSVACVGVDTDKYLVIACYDMLFQVVEENTIIATIRFGVELF